jgi:myo-inositol-1(or 4)-monophosphatase
VSRVDREVQALLVARLRQRYPEDRVLAEEGSAGSAAAEFCWALDPLDGTRAYLSGLPIWGISLGLLRQGEPVLGVFAMPAVGETYHGDATGAFCNGEPLSRPGGAAIDDPLAFFAAPSNAHLRYQIDLPRVRSLGSVAAHLVYVARGAAIATLTRRIWLWDLAGVLPILHHTGIALRYLSGAPFDIRPLLSGEPASEPLLAAPPALIAELRSRIAVR